MSRHLFTDMAWYPIDANNADPHDDIRFHALALLSPPKKFNFAVIPQTSYLTVMLQWRLGAQLRLPHRRFSRPPNSTQRHTATM